MEKEQIKDLIELLEKALEDELVEKLTIVIKPKKQTTKPMRMAETTVIPHFKKQITKSQ